AQYLPFYVVTGNLAGDPAKQVREQFESWVQRGYPTLWAEYKGRGVEWFGAEVPTIFDWMRPKRRAFPRQQRGSDGNGGPFGNELGTLRPEGNHFYWLGADDVRPGRVNNASSWRRDVPPATLTGRIDPQANDIFLTASGVGQVTVWLGRTTGGR